MLPTALREKIRTMGVSDAIEMLVREMGMPHQTAMQEMVRLLEQGSRSRLRSGGGDWEYTAPDAGVCTFLPA